MSDEVYLLLFAAAVSSAVYLVATLWCKVSDHMRGLKDAIAPPPDPNDRYWHDQPS